MMDMVKSDGNVEEMVEERERRKVAARKIAEFKGMLNERAAAFLSTGS